MPLVSSFPLFLSFALFLVLVQGENNPLANPKAVVTSGKARFTVLTSHIIRLEYGAITDTATFAFLNRNLPVPDFSKAQDGDWLVLKTDAVELRYLTTTSDQSFEHTNLLISIMLNGKKVSWSPQPTWNRTVGGNLLGTFRTLDGDGGDESINLDCYQNTRPDLHCTLGLVSRDGYVVVDDTNSPQFDNSSWPWVHIRSLPSPDKAMCDIDGKQRQNCGYYDISELDCVGKGCCRVNSERGNVSRVGGVPDCYYSKDAVRDLYFLGHGHNYTHALYEFTLLAGKIPLPPRFAFGVFYSRYWAFSDVGQKEIVNNYQSHEIPLDTLVTDMDWHITFYKEAAEGKRDQAGQSIGWTGFTWDKHLFPNPKEFLDWCKARGLKNTLNLHPASGIQPWEEKYKEMAVAMGIDPATQKYVPFDPTNVAFVTNWFKIALGEREDEGIDFWWLDWQQGEGWIQLAGVNPTFWLNYLFFTNPYHWQKEGGNKRPMLLHRFGGLGNHRYQTGFSGDVIPHWASLDFQVYFTITASNVGFGYWSHDIGGHILPSPSELYTRWIQWGALSPMFRTHCTKDPNNFRDIWRYPAEVYPYLRDGIVLRGSLVPYLYTQARHAYDTGVSPLRPMYYYHPEDEEAYSYRTQYYFGDSFLSAPVTQPIDNATGLATKQIWFPKGETFVGWQSGLVMKGPLVVNLTCTLYEIPVFGRAGSVVPLQQDGYEASPLGTAQIIPIAVKLLVFCGGDVSSSGGGMLYEDDGKTTDYQMDKHGVLTKFTYMATGDSLSLDVSAASGMTFDGFPEKRSYQIQFLGSWPASHVTVNGQSIPYAAFESAASYYSSDSWTYDGSSLSLFVHIVSPQPTNTPVQIRVTTMFPQQSPLLTSGYPRMMLRMVKAKQLLDNQWDADKVYQEDYEALLDGAETGQRITDNCKSALDEMTKFQGRLDMAISQVKQLKHLHNDIRDLIQAQLSG